MKIIHAAYVIVLLLFLSFIACENCDCDVEGEVALFLLEGYETFEKSPEIDFGTVVLQEVPILSYDDLKSYNSKEYYFRLSDVGRKRIEEMDHSVSGIAFAVTANDELIYTGYFLPSYSSLVLQWLVIDPLFWGRNNRMDVVLSYPGQIEGLEIPDFRNDDRILEIFRRDGKLVE